MSQGGVVENTGENLFDELKRYVAFEQADEQRLVAIGLRVAPHFKDIIADHFYERILEHPGARAAITGGAEQVERLKGTLVQWLHGLFQGTYDARYYEQRARIGRRHVEISLPQQYMFTAMNVIRVRLTELVMSTATQPSEVHLELAAMNKIMDMELAIMLHTYREDYLAAVQRSERLATFGQLVGSIGHELRNPLSVIESSLYLMKGRLPTDERTTRHMEKIDAQVKLSNRIISDLLDMVRDGTPVRTPTRPVDLVTQALEAVTPPPGVTFELDVPVTLPRVMVDQSQLRQVLLNLASNALDALAGHGSVRISGAAHGAMVHLLVNDSGPGVDTSIQARLFEPLVTTRARGVGLGLALCRKFMERNGGSIELTKGGLPGAAFLLRLPVAQAG